MLLEEKFVWNRFFFLVFKSVWELVLILLITACYFVAQSFSISSASKINYTEKSDADYKVYLKENNYYYIYFENNLRQMHEIMEKCYSFIDGRKFVQDSYDDETHIILDLVNFYAMECNDIARDYAYTKFSRRKQTSCDKVTKQTEGCST